MKIKEKKQLEEIKNINVGSEPLKAISFFSTISEETKKLMERIKPIDDWFATAQLICKKTDGKTEYNFNKFTLTLKFASKNNRRDLTLQKEGDDQQDLQILINNVDNNYNPRSESKIKWKVKEKEDALKSAKKLIVIREGIINAFKISIFLT